MITYNKKKGIICIILAALSFSTMGMLVKLSGDVPVFEKALFRNMISLIAAGVALFASGKGLHIPKGSGKFYATRSIAGTIGILGNFYAIDHLVLSDATTIAKLAPFFILIFSYLLLKEKIAFYQIFCLIGAFCGSLLVIKPGFHGGDAAASFIGVAGALGAGLAYASIRKLSTFNADKNSIIFIFSIVSCVAVLPFVGSFIPLTGKQVICLLGAGVAAACGQFAVTAAYTYAPAREISVYDYSQIVFAAFWSIIIFNQLADVYSFIGYLIVIGSAILNTVIGNKKSN